MTIIEENAPDPKPASICFMDWSGLTWTVVLEVSDW